MNQEKLLYDGFHKITEITATIKGADVIREKLLVPSAVGGIVVDENHRIALVTQYRPTLNQHTKEIPAGILDKDLLSIKGILIEELEEECEIKREEIAYISDVPVHEYFMITGSSDAKISLYLVLVTNQENKQVQDKDVESVEWVDLHTMRTYINDKKIVDPKTIIAYYYLFNTMNQE